MASKAEGAMSGLVMMIMAVGGGERVGLGVCVYYLGGGGGAKGRVRGSDHKQNGPRCLSGGRGGFRVVGECWAVLAYLLRLSLPVLGAPRSALGPLSIGVAKAAKPVAKRGGATDGHGDHCPDTVWPVAVCRKRRVL